MKIKLLLSAIIVIFLSSPLSAQWYYASTPGGGRFSFPDINTGYTTSGGIVKKTIDAGLTWETILDLDLVYGDSKGIFFTNTETGWVSADDHKLYHTTDGGLTWSEVLDMGSSGESISFVDNNHGWAKNFSNFYRTTDGGQTWNQHTLGFYAAVCNFFFINPNTGWVGNYSYMATTIQKTTDGGLTWAPKQTVNAIFYSIQFINELTGWGAGYSGQVYKTIDGGETWTIQNSNIPHTINKICMINESTGWIGTDYAWGGTSNMAYTTDGGDNWMPVVKPENVRITDIVFFGETGIGYMIMGGKLYKASNNGIITSITGTGNNIPEKFSLFQNYPNPFNPSTNIKFNLSRTGFVSLKVFDITGKEVQSLITSQMNAGEYEYQFNAEGLASGIYYYKLSDGVQSEVKKMMLLR
jgi:photosystem II stability/assembly factor-like uncharacterized protein